MDKEKMIKEMIDNDLQMIRDNQNNDGWLVDILLNGFVGYNNQPDNEIKQEYNERFQE